MYKFTIQNWIILNAVYVQAYTDILKKKNTTAYIVLDSSSVVIIVYHQTREYRYMHCEYVHYNDLC